MQQITDRILSFLLPFWKNIKRWSLFRKILGFEECIYTRFVSDIETRKLVTKLEPDKLQVLEISGSVWKNFGFEYYQNVHYPEFDICKDSLDRQFDLVIAEQIFEHLLYPYSAGKNIYNMLEPSGHFLIVTPFLFRVHPNPYDCTRWTETGLKFFCIECGFNPEGIQTGSWGNRACIKMTFRQGGEFQLYNRFLHSLTNEPEYPLVIWALAQK